MRNVLITAGATRNPIDAMRFISARASGRTGVGLARALGPAGVTLLGSPEAILRAPGELNTIEFGSTQDLFSKLETWVHSHPNSIVIHSAAVGDYAVSTPAEGRKIPSGQVDLELKLVPTPKILDHIKTWSPAVFLVSFKAAPPGTSTDALITLTSKQATRTKSEIVFGNVLGQVGRGVVLVSSEKAQLFDERSNAVHELLLRIKQVRGEG